MNANQFNNTKLVLASINNVNYVKDTNKVNNDKNVNYINEVKEEKEDKQLSFEEDLARLKALSAKRKVADELSLDSLREETQEKESLDSSQWREGLCDGPARDHWARFRCQYFFQETKRGTEHKIKLLLKAEDESYIELMSNVGRSYDFQKGVEALMLDDPWYKSILKELTRKNTKFGKFYIANTKSNAKKNRNTVPVPYTAVTVTQVENGVYEVNIWLWNSRWNLLLTDSFLTEKQQKGNMLAKTEWFNEKSKINHKTESALDMLGWNKKKGDNNDN